MEIQIEKIREIASSKTNNFNSTHPNYTSTEKALASMLLRMKLELDAVMQLAVDKWLDDDDTNGNPASRAARAREFALTTIDKAENEAEKLRIEQAAFIGCLEELSKFPELPGVHFGVIIDSRNGVKQEWVVPADHVIGIFEAIRRHAETMLPFGHKAIMGMRYAERMKEREKLICEALGGVCDGGMFIKDILARIEKMRKALEANLGWLTSNKPMTNQELVDTFQNLKEITRAALAKNNG